MITIDDFAKVEFKVGTVLEAQEVEGSEKLIKLTVDLGEESPRTILTGMKTWYNTDHFKGRQLVFITNLEPRMMMGMESQGMIMATDSEDGPVLLQPEKEVPPGSKIR
jgi:methionine--tRNA ligase beta chain